jgi:hypothetical protein
VELPHGTIVLHSQQGRHETPPGAKKNESHWRPCFPGRQLSRWTTARDARSVSSKGWNLRRSWQRSISTLDTSRFVLLFDLEI